MNKDPKSIRLLMHGYDPVLLETRCLILTMAGFGICTITGPNTFKSVLEAGAEPYDLWIICHTVPLEERESIALLAAHRQTSTFQVETFIQPQDLLAEVTRIMAVDQRESA